MQPSLLAKRAWLVLFLAIGAFYLWGLGSMPLVGPDEPRYAQVAREMFLRKDPITPTLGGLPWFEKPPLLYWLMMLSYRMLGVSEYAARLGPAVCGLLTGVFVYWIGTNISKADRKFGDGDESSYGRWVALVWLTSLGALAFSRAASVDIVLTMTVAGALGAFFAAELRSRSAAARLSGWLVLFHAFTGLSLLAKGLIGYVIVYGTVALYYLLRRERPAAVLLKSFLWGFPLSLALASTWYGPILSRHGWTFIDRFIIQHHFQRFVSNKYHHPGPIYFYIPVIIGLAVPWTVFLGGALWSARLWNWRGESAVDRARVLGLAWLVVPAVFFSFSGSKLTAYVLPVLPGICLLVGERIVCYLRQSRGQLVLPLTGGCMFVIATVAIAMAQRQLGFGFWIPALALFPALIVGTVALVRPQLRKSLLVLIAIVPILTSILLLRFIAPAMAREEGVRDMIAIANGRGYANAQIVQLHLVEHTPEFYAAGRIGYGSDGELVWYETVGDVVAATKRNQSVLCLVPVEYESQLLNSTELQAEVIAGNGRIALIALRAR